MSTFPAPGPPSVRGAGRGWVNQATAAPVRATGHSTTPAAPSSPAPAYTAIRRPRGETAPTLSRVSSAALPTVPAPGTLRSTEAAPCRGAVRTDDDFCSAMTLLGLIRPVCPTECPRLHRSSPLHPGNVTDPARATVPASR
ncbi:hypothetical protein D9753_31460 [Streptomyces dangxiongensis]|uniref:Uncharacterized protein n=1 Tax=Streptomyces dangxiongensis TaxID=1442032 RepID=A0A3G2JJN0_9ACTN|nr:hypothetical protein D9753_31460 [Streptomyces dangxiongensis]